MPNMYNDIVTIWWFASLTLSLYLDESVVWERSLQLGVIAASMFGAR